MTDQASSLVAEPRIFLSYAHSDQSFVDRLASDLRTLGIGVWVDTWELERRASPASWGSRYHGSSQHV